ncbi:MAG: 4-hydroxythreonine-4-phosphate dehydrogenase PdxA [Proteobacteria bacterium]|nr:4-hydroxythreonine-4-phosphate dehydrogenase PdxA [Pseudomonadota bacterium]
MPLIITIGDPRGIGAEVVCKALELRHQEGRLPPVVLVGDIEAVRREARGVLSLPIREVGEIDVDEREDGVGFVPVLDPGTSMVEVASLDVAVEAILAGRASALVTGPINKESLVKRGFHHHGHTEYLAELCQVERPVMAFAGGRLRVALVTTHLPLRCVADALTSERVLYTIEVAARALRLDLALQDPLVLVCGLNPHAGDGGVLGMEEKDIIEPAIHEARRRGLRVEGPVSAETAFLRALKGDGELIVAMYHDQGLAPLKAVDFGRSVNWTLGLPIIRTSVDHGTAYELLGKGGADPASMVAALTFAEEMVVARRVR